MNRYRLSKAGISVKEGIERFNDNLEVYEKCLYEFPEDDHYNQLLTALEEDDAQSAFAAAHALKGVAGNLSLTRLYADIVPLVEVLRAGTVNGADALFEPVTIDYKEVIEALTTK